jgi:hypothetical protein
MSTQLQADFINHRSLKPSKMPVFTTVMHQQQQQLGLMSHKRNANSKAILQQYSTKLNDASI